MENQEQTSKVFVYGTLKGGGRLHKHFLSTAKFLRKCSIQGRIYDLGSFPGAKLQEEGIIHGEVYEVDARTLVALDRLEGHPDFYKRVKVGGGMETYEYQGRIRDARWIESGNYEAKAG